MVLTIPCLLRVGDFFIMGLGVVAQKVERLIASEGSEFDSCQLPLIKRERYG